MYEGDEIRGTDVTNANMLNNIRVNVTRLFPPVPAIPSPSTSLTGWYSYQHIAMWSVSKGTGF